MSDANDFMPNIDLDAACVCAAMQGGVTAMLSVALRSGCPTPDVAMARAKWLKDQPEQYIDDVSVRVDAMMQPL